MPTRRELANAIRALAMDAVQKADSGHPGMPMGMADIAEVLFNDFLRHSPANPKWPGRDRFLLSNGHGCMLQYAALHLSGYDLPMEEIKRFRQLHSITPGHPEYGHTPGIEVTTGPLGQGIGNGVGLALAEALLASQFNRPGHEIVNHHTYVFCGDGCLMEGVSHEASSLAGTLGLGKLIMIYDDNGISIDGEVKGWFHDDSAKRFQAYGWHTIGPIDGLDAEAVKQALKEARLETKRPSLILARTIIGFGAPDKQGTAATHGSALGAEEVAAARKTLDWKYPAFEIPDEIYAGWDARERGAKFEAEWRERFKAYEKEHPELAAELRRRLDRRLPDQWAETAKTYIAKTAREGKARATRKASGAALAAYQPVLPELVGGSADLTPSNDTEFPGAQVIQPGKAEGNYLHWGVREFGMTATLNGMNVHGGLIAYGGTFLTFSDYARNAVRLAALGRYPTILVYTHDSIGLGEDGPTHQPIEHLASLRAIPNLTLWRPADDVETAVAWQDAIERSDGPTAFALTRQSVPHYDRSDEQVAAIRRGGYVLHEPEKAPTALIIATGSEVALAMEAAKSLAGEGTPTRVVSMPCVELFLAQDKAWQDKVLPRAIRARVAVEAGVTMPWYRFVGDAGRIVGLERFGESAPGEEVFDELGFTPAHVAAAMRESISAAAS
ncbi:MAG: transketolase [Gammaproteobacteria bacterium]